MLKLDEKSEEIFGEGLTVCVEGGVVGMWDTYFAWCLERLREYRSLKPLRNMVK